MTKTGDGIVLSAAPRQSEAHPSSLTQVVEEVKARLGELWLPRIYCDRILTIRTRSHQLHVTAKKADVEIQHTLLGVELKIGRHRMSCPDLATARYLAVFARAGCMDVAVPYDISRISRLADELESSWHRMLLLIEHVAGRREQAFRSRLRNLLIANARREI
ncbi:MAG: hypothetical protein H0U54_08870, partial [Acidobacteria bacterium]|nr:hypothetical protein [Acidobacteriota bacterium]